MQAIFFAPELSATSRIVPIWIMVSTSYSARFTISRTRQRFVFDSGRLETISTSSPTLHRFSSSWA